ncbi:MAG: CAP domain-containing protein [Bryobacteraceae bacterium]
MRKSFSDACNCPRGARSANRIYAVTGAEYLPQQIVNGWAGEAKDFDLAANKCKEDRICGHYTQIVWRRTKQVGCAVARGGNREVWVCEYSPRGNHAGMRPYELDLLDR